MAWREFQYHGLGVIEECRQLGECVGMREGGSCLDAWLLFHHPIQCKSLPSFENTGHSLAYVW